MTINLQQCLGRGRKQNKYNPHHITIRDNWELGPDKDGEKDFQNKRGSIITNTGNIHYIKKRKLVHWSFVFAVRNRSCGFNFLPFMKSVFDFICE